MKLKIIGFSKIFRIIHFGKVREIVQFCKSTGVVEIIIGKGWSLFCEHSRNPEILCPVEI